MSHDLPLQQLRAVGLEYSSKRKLLPTLIVAVLPDGGTDIYTAIKQ